MAVSVGIDLGTTFCAVAYVPQGSDRPVIIPNSEGKKITPSVIQFVKGKTIFGSEAESAHAVGEEGCAATFKRSMGSDEPYCYIGGKAYTAVDLSALLLKHLKDEAEAELGDTIQDAVITVPAYFYSAEREATIEAATRAGIKVRKIIDEPNAAAMAYGLDHWRENANILVYDLGGGTFDVTLTRMGREGDLRTVVTRGDHYLGGRDWDARIESILLDKTEAETGIDLRDSEYITIIRGLCEETKKKLTSMRETQVRFSIPDYGYTAVSITRAEFEASTEDLIERTGTLCRAVLDEAHISARDVTDILLVGGSTRMPQVSEYLTREFGKKPITHVNPDEAVALGAAIQATKTDSAYTSLSVAVMNGKKETDRRSLGRLTNTAVRPQKKLGGLGVIRLQETTAHAMGIVAVSPDGTKYINDVIIPANHPRPVKAAKAYYTSTKRNETSEMEVFVTQGGYENPLENQIPFRYIVSGIRYIPHQHNSTLVRVQYSYDNNGVIHVEARQEDDTVNLPVRKEKLPADLSSLAGNVQNLKTQGMAPKGNQVGLYSKWAGISNIPATSRDQFGNPSGSEYDLAEDGSFEGQKIVILNLCADSSATLKGTTQALQSKGFAVECVGPAVPTPKELEALLDDACQLWVISQADLRFNDEHMDVIRSFYEEGNGLYIWGDNDPLNVDANFIIERLFHAFLSGDYYGDKVIGIQEDLGSPGILEDHLISTGIVSFYEGITISHIDIAGGLEPLIYSTDQNIVTAFYDRDGKRALVDGAFTRLWDFSWGKSAGTSRYIVNAAAWLANQERFVKSTKSAKSSADDLEDRNVDTW